MSKNKIIMAACGGGAAVVVLIVLALAFSAFNETTELEEQMEGAQYSLNSIVKSKIPPEQKSIVAFNENRDKLETWKSEAMALVSRGDFAIRHDLTEAAFKKQMVDDARAMSDLPGKAEGKIVAENFGFGFKDIITGASMPELSKLPAMQRQWQEIKLFVNVFAESGVDEIASINVVEPKVAEEPTSARKGKNKETGEKSSLPPPQNYTISFLAKPAAMVRVLNAFATSERFIVVDDLSFSRAKDELSAVLGDGDKKGAAARTTRTRRKLASEVEEKEESVKKGLVTDPATACSLTVTLKISTYDFGTKALPCAASEEEPQ